MTEVKGQAPGDEVSLKERTEARDVIRAGLIGKGILLSKSPSMHIREAKAQGLSLTYELFDIATMPNRSLVDVLTFVENRGFAGVNVTHPYKQEMIALLDDLSDDARAVGAVNTVLFQRGRRIGHNTDCFGFAEGFRRGLPNVDKRRVVQIGAGGAGAAVAFGLLSLGVEELLLSDVNTVRAEELARGLSARFGAERAKIAGPLEAAVAGADGVVNATPIGMSNYPGMPIEASWLRPDLWVAEIIYVPLQTELLRRARLAGCRTLDGGAMAVFQAAEAFNLFTGVTADAERMLREFRDGLAN